MPAEEQALEIRTGKCPKCYKEFLLIEQEGADSEHKCCGSSPDDGDEYSIELSPQGLEQLTDVLGLSRCAVCNRALALSGQRKNITLIFRSADLNSVEYVPCCQSCRSTASEQDLTSACKRYLDDKGSLLEVDGSPQRYSEEQIREVLFKVFAR